jgi:ubiquinone/menaquinone biosynthesis C-methylase UbiE
MTRHAGRPRPACIDRRAHRSSATAAQNIDRIYSRAMSYQPELYDLVTGSSLQGDVAWYCDQARRSGGPVLELGAGTGRVTLPMAAAGVSVHALDAHDGMLARLRAKLAEQASEIQSRVTVVHADMRTFALDERFALIVSPFRAFLHNLTEADQLACLTRVRRHLAPRGRFAFNVFHPSLTFMAQHAGALAGTWRWRGTHDLPSGGWVVLSEATHYDTVAQRVHSLQQYEVYRQDGSLEKTSMFRIELAYLYPADIKRLLHASGFSEITIKGGFDGRKFTRDGEELVVEAW